MTNTLPPFGDPRLAYETTLTQAALTEVFPQHVGGELVKTQMIFLDELPIFAIKSGDAPLSERELYQAYLTSVEEAARQAEIMLAEVQHRVEADQHWEESQPKDPREVMP